MILSSWNVNSVRARIDNILGYLDLSRPDILMMQESKQKKKTFLIMNLKMLDTIPLCQDKKVITG